MAIQYAELLNWVVISLEHRAAPSNVNSLDYCGDLACSPSDSAPIVDFYYPIMFRRFRGISELVVVILWSTCRQITKARQDELTHV
ncbi:hypothetical protein cyc_05102 [Cyclospora cayetanensis]|uniref:Uncharacterized protein n=1 Tax=Cyclospora cayetanensis TaxID=88456 RepID=A0A1D3CZ90_9EIME|nr:hypothetical protein cyc_05102 [Cyclospora cayetanensis]